MDFLLTKLWMLFSQVLAKGCEVSPTDWTDTVLNPVLYLCQFAFRGYQFSFLALVFAAEKLNAVLLGVKLFLHFAAHFISFAFDIGLTVTVWTVKLSLIFDSIIQKL